MNMRGLDKTIPMVWVGRPQVGSEWKEVEGGYDLPEYGSVPWSPESFSITHV